MDPRLDEFATGSTATLYGGDNDRPRSFGQMLRQKAAAGVVIATAVTVAWSPAGAGELKEEVAQAPSYQVVSNLETGGSPGASCAWIADVGNGPASDAEIISDAKGIAALVVNNAEVTSRAHAIGLLEDICKAYGPMDVPSAALGLYL